MAKYRFVQWTDETGAVVGTSPSITLLVDRDKTLTAHYEEVPTHVLSITSDPILGVPFTIDGVTQVTPYSDTLEEKSYTIVMPTSVSDPDTGTVYNFREWEDGSTERTRTILLNTDMNLIAYFEEAAPPPPPTHLLSINSDPIAGIEFTLNNSKQVTPFEGTLQEGLWTITMPTKWTHEGTEYEFVRWNDDLTTPSREILLNKDISLTAYYQKTPPPPIPPYTVLAVGLAVGAGATLIVTRPKKP